MPADDISYLFVEMFDGRVGTFIGYNSVWEVFFRAVTIGANDVIDRKMMPR